MESYELDLLLTSLPLARADRAEQQAFADSTDAAATPLSQLTRGNYAAALTTALKQLPILPNPDKSSATPESSPDWFDLWKTIVLKHLPDTSAHENLLYTAVAALYVFTQANLTGPALAPGSLPGCPFDLLISNSSSTADQQATTTNDTTTATETDNDGFGRDTASPSDRWASAQLCENGEDLIGRVYYPQYLLLALNTLLLCIEDIDTPLPSSPSTASSATASTDKSQQSLPLTWRWWAMRAVFLQQRLLSARSAALKNRLTTLSTTLLHSLLHSRTSTTTSNIAHHHQQQQQQQQQVPGCIQQLIGVAELETFLIYIHYGDVAEAKAHLHAGCQALGVEVHLTGVLGVRTAHQQEAKAQLVVNTTCLKQQPPQTIAVTATSTAINSTAEQGSLVSVGDDATVLEAAFAGTINAGAPNELQGLADESDVLSQPKLLVGSVVGGKSVDSIGEELGEGVSALEQAAILAHCTLLTKGSSVDDLKVREAAAYSEAILRQHTSTFIAHAAALLQSSRAERSRSRTKERALLHLEGLDAALRGSLSSPPSSSQSQGSQQQQLAVAVERRMKLGFTVRFPLTVSLQRELGESLVALGLVGAALSIFESLELWDNLILCYQLLDKKVQAEQLCRRRLEATPDDPRLLCALGDLLQDESCYERAWEASGGRNTRSQRSLARAATSREDYMKAALHWETALNLNPLHPEGWFSLGYCRIKQKDYSKAMAAFTRCVQMDCENGEAWNNLAAVHMHLENWPQALGALSEAVKHKRDSWHTWDNYATVAVKAGQRQVAVRALGEVATLTDGQRLNLKVLESLVESIEEQGEQQEGGVSGGGGDVESVELEEVEVEAAAEAELAAVLSAVTLLSTTDTISPPPSSSTTTATEEQQQATTTTTTITQKQDIEKQDRARKLLIISLGTLFKRLASTASGGSGFWGLYARYYIATNETDAAKECLLKRVRALQGGSWADSDEAAFVEFASASIDLCRAYVDGGVEREIGSARMHLRSMLKRAKEMWGEHEMYGVLEGLLKEVVSWKK